MGTKLRLMRFLIVTSGLLALAAPLPAFAHENVGGDEAAVLNWMLVAALTVAVMGAVAAVWAWRSGQFSDVEVSKYSMLDTAEDFDAVMAEADAREMAALAPALPEATALSGGAEPASTRSSEKHAARV